MLKSSSKEARQLAKNQAKSVKHTKAIEQIMVNSWDEVKELINSCSNVTKVLRSCLKSSEQKASDIERNELKVLEQQHILQEQKAELIHLFNEFEEAKNTYKFEHRHLLAELNKTRNALKVEQGRHEELVIQEEKIKNLDRKLKESTKKIHEYTAKLIDIHTLLDQREQYIIEQKSELDQREANIVQQEELIDKKQERMLKQNEQLQMQRKEIFERVQKVEEQEVYLEQERLDLAYAKQLVEQGKNKLNVQWAVLLEREEAIQREWESQI